MEAERGGTTNGPENGPAMSEKKMTIPGVRKDKHNLDYVLRSGLAGGLAGCAVSPPLSRSTKPVLKPSSQAKTVVGPLDRVKILFQASNPQFAKYSGSWNGMAAAMRDINQADGLRGLFRGHSATLLRIFPYAGIKFLAYEQYRALAIPSPDYETSLRRLLAGSLAGVTSVFFTYPLELIRVRLAFETRRDQQRASLSRICRQIYHERPSPPAGPAPGSSPAVAVAAQAVEAATPRAGLANFYRGFSPTLVGMVPYAGFSFLTHDLMGDWLRRPRLAPYTTLPDAAPAGPRPPRLTNVAELVAGAVAGLVSQTAAYPLEVIRRRMQVGGAVGAGERHGMRATARAIWWERGPRGFFVGLFVGYAKIAPMVAVSFWVYERSKRALGI